MRRVKPCTYVGCTGTVRTTGRWCPAHFKQLQRRGSVEKLTPRRQDLYSQPKPSRLTDPDKVVSKVDWVKVLAG